MSLLLLLPSAIFGDLIDWTRTEKKRKREKGKREREGNQDEWVYRTKESCDHVLRERERERWCTPANRTRQLGALAFFLFFILFYSVDYFYSRSGLNVRKLEQRRDTSLTTASFWYRHTQKKKSREGAVKKGENSAIIATGGDLLEPTEKP